MQDKRTQRRRTKTKTPGVFRSVSGRYEIAYTDSDGAYVQKAVADTYEEAKAIRAEIMAKRGRGEVVRDSKRRFEDFATEVIAGLTSRPRTIEKHSYHLRKHLTPALGNKRLTEITANDVAKVIAKMTAGELSDGKPLSGRTTNAAVATLSFVMSEAKRQRLIPANPVHDIRPGVRPKNKRQTEKRALSQSEIATLLGKAGDTFRPLIATMIFTGLRLGEVLGLQWQHIDFESGEIHVRGQLDRAGNVTEAKTDNSRRDVTLMTDLAAELRKHKEEAFSRGQAKATDFVFVNPDGSRRSHYSTHKGVKRAIERAKLGDGISSHSFRHTYASLLIVDAGYNAVAVSKQLGHARPSFTQDIYVHLFDKAEHKKQMRETMDREFGHLLAVNAMSDAPGFDGSPAGGASVLNLDGRS